MKTTKILAVTISVFFLSCADNGKTNAQVIENLSAADFSAKLKQEKNEILIDVRTAEEIAQGHLADATFIDYYSEDFQKRIAVVRKDVPIFVYCRSGGRSSSAAQKMQEMGFTKIYNMLGGIGAWNEAGLPTEKSKKEIATKAQVISEKDFLAVVQNNAVVLVDFHTQWCVPCKKLVPIVDEIAKENKGEIIVLKIDMDANKALAEKYKVNSVPTLILFRQNKEVWRNTGFLPKVDILKAIR